MSLRSENRAQFWSRLTIVTLFCLVVHATIVAESGGGGTFKVWRPDRMRIVLVELVVIGLAAYEFRLKKGAAEEEVKSDKVDEDAKSEEHKEEKREEPVVKRDEVKKEAKNIEREEKVVERARGIKGTRAEQAWQEARQIKHRFVPSLDIDYAYLALVHEAARLGHAMACFKLGEYAVRRQTLVEAYYWFKLALSAGAEGADAQLRTCLRQWRIQGYNPEYENVTGFFTERQGVLGRAALRLDSGVDAVQAKLRLKEMLSFGDREAEFMLRKL